MRWPVAVLVCAALAWAPASAAQPASENAAGQVPAVAVLLDATDQAVAMHPALQSGATEALEALRSQLGARARVVWRATLAAPMRECDLEGDAACAARIRRALGGRVVFVRVEHTRGACVPMPGGGTRMTLATVIETGTPGRAPATRVRVESNAPDGTLLATLLEAATRALAR